MLSLTTWLKRWRWIDRLLVRLQAYTALLEQYPWIKQAIYAAVTAVMGLYTYFSESWVPFAILVAVGSFIALQLLPKAIQTDKATDRLSEGAFATWDHDAAEEAPDRTAYYDLMGFTLEYLLPACDRQIELQEAAIRRVSNSDKLTELAIDGLRTSSAYVTFWQYYNLIEEGISSSEYTIKFSALIECIRKLEANRYKSFCRLGDEFAAANNIDYQSDATIRTKWKDWIDAHNALVREYDKIKTQVRFGALFKPRRESRWGGAIAPDTTKRGSG